jgi:hypothetical protein
VVTDPPYKLTSGGNTPGGMKGGWLDDYNNNGCVVECDISWREIMRLLRDACEEDADLYVMANDKNVCEAGAAAKEANLGFHNLLVWDKVGATANRWYILRVCPLSLEGPRKENCQRWFKTIDPLSAS